ncbi:MAG: nucleoside 2-deoxyribosyltransferase [Candidatus Nanoarchaeia archaeon]
MINKSKIYFAGSIRGGREDREIYKTIIQLLQHYGEVLTEHIADFELKEFGETQLSDEEIHNRDMNWLLQSDVIVAEVTNPSLGVGYEIGRAIENNKNVICLYRRQENKQLSAMIGGCKKARVIEYENMEELENKIGLCPEIDFFSYNEAHF